MTEDAFVILSSDGHAGALMHNYRPYLDPAYRTEFDDFVKEWDAKGSRNFDPPALAQRIDPEYIREWSEKMVESGRLEGYPDPNQRLRELDREGITGEILFPDFGIPFELYSRTLASSLGVAPTDYEHKHAGMRAFNRWVMDFVSVAPWRFAPMMMLGWTDVDAAVAELTWGAEAGFTGVLLGEFEPDKPCYHPDFEPIWHTIEDLGLVVNIHSGMSATSNRPIFTPGAPHPACGSRMFQDELFFVCQNYIAHLIWGAVLERHPRIKVVFTEMGSSWVVPKLRDMDYTYNGSYMRTDYKDEVIPHKPSEYWARQCYLGSSTFSREEVRYRHVIGIDKMMLGMDFPHHEGTLLETTQEYLKASLGHEQVPEAEARQMLGGNAAELFGFDLPKLQAHANEVRTAVPSEILVVPDEDLFPRGDIHKPAFFSAGV
jgi:predicted TIM-barrel fold metal-dependent hydrolase